MLFVTAYESPDLDGVACAFAYAEFLNKTGIKATAAIFGKIHREAQHVFDRFNITALPNAEKLIASFDKIVIVDASDILGVSSKIELKKVVEIIDHRKVNDAASFPNAKIQIELVGSCATLISEKYFENNIEPSKESAILLYSAIISNTINFKNNITTPRDKKMADFLKSKIKLPDNYAFEMFRFKSQFNAPLKDIFDADLANIKISGKLFTILQLELIGVQKFVNNNMSEIQRIMIRKQKEESADYIFVTLIDVEKVFNLFICFDDKTKEILENALRIKFLGNTAKREGILMRKEIVPKIKEGFVGG